MSGIKKNRPMDKDSALIGALLADGTVETITLYGEGKPERLLPIFRDKYNTTMKIQNILDFGDLKTFGTSLTTSVPTGKYSDITLGGVKSLLSRAKKGNVAHVYLFDLANKKWLYYDVKTGESINEEVEELIAWPDIKIGSKVEYIKPMTGVEVSTGTVIKRYKGVDTEHGVALIVDDKTKKQYPILSTDIKGIVYEGIIKLTPIVEAIESDSDLEEAIREYKKVEAETTALQIKLKDQLDDLNTKQKDTSAKLKDIEKYMKRFDIAQKKVETWVFSIVEQLKYEKIRADYKELWLTAFGKVNEATRGVLESLEEAQLAAKKIEKEKVLKVVDEGIKNWIETLYNKFVGYFKSVNKYEIVTEKLPKV